MYQKIKNKKIAIISIYLILLFSGLEVICQASPLQWKKYKSFKYDLKTLPVGKTVETYLSPDKRYELISRKEIPSKNLFKLYLHKGKIYTFIDEFQEIQKIKWETNSSKVSFHGIKEIEYDQISYWKIRYLPEKNLMLAMVLKINK